MLEKAPATDRDFEPGKDRTMTPGERKTIVITGATKGLGLALTDRLSGMGHTLIGCGRTAALIEELTRRIPPPARFSVVDMASRASVSQWAERVLAETGPPDLLINNAAVINENAPLWKVPPDEFDSLIDINIKGVFYAIAAFAPAMTARGSGVIINMSSGWGRSVAADVAPYCASKWAIEGLSRALALEVPAGMAVIPLNPGVIDTEMLRSSFGESAEHYPSAEAWARLAAPFILGLGPKENGRPMSVPN